MKLIFVGDGPVRDRLARENPDFIFSGMKVGTELAQYYASGDVLLFPSETETFGNVVLEGMASGLVVLAFDYAAAAEHIQSGDNGYSCQLHDHKGFMQQAMNICNRWPTISVLRENARDHALSNDWANTLDRFEQLMSSVCVRA